PTPTPSGDSSVTFTVTTPGAIGRATTITARSTGISTPRYRFAVRNPSGSWSRPCGTYDTESTCSFMPSIVGTWTIRVWARDASSSELYDAAAVDTSYTVSAAGAATCPHEATSTDFRGDPRNAAGFIRYCWPGEASCYCDADDDCYVQPGYVGCR
ncbi:MAG: hypothetical protein KA978_28155, partial [Deltaproteobacteria bacterium]|nr:hypothetical protein [Deltaproteobacteria bacterium]